MGPRCWHHRQGFGCLSEDVDLVRTFIQYLNLRMSRARAVR
jgi:hypothetical protein